MANVREKETRTSESENTPLLTSQERSDDEEDSTLPTVEFNCARCKTSCVRRFVPKDKGVFLLLFVYSMESFAFYSATKGIRELLFDEDVDLKLESNSRQQQIVLGTFLYTLLSHSLGRLLYPVAGFLADSFLGRYKVIEIGLWLISCGLILICISLSIVDQVPHSIGRILLPVLCIILFVIGTASVEVNAVSFGVDQLPQGCPSDQISSYFFWYYFFRNLSILVGVGLAVILLSLPPIWKICQERYYFPDLQMHIMSLDIHHKVLIFMIFATAIVSVGLFVHVVKHHWYFKNTQRDNPVKTVLNVTWFSMTVKRHAPIYRRTFRYGEARQPRIELAKIEYDGVFEAETVEDVKTFYQILFLILSLGGFFASYGAVYSMLSSQLQNRGKEIFGDSLPILATHFVQLINTATIVVFLPIINHTMLPFTSISLKVRLGIGQAVNLLALLIASLFQGAVEDKDNNREIEKLLWLFFPSIILSIGEALTFVTGLEFIYAQAPEPMKGLLTGLFYFVFGVCDGIVSIIFYVSPQRSDQEQDYTLWFYIGSTLIAIIGLIVYTIIVCLYRNRRRPAADEDDLTRRIYAQNVFGNDGSSTAT